MDDAQVAAVRHIHYFYHPFYHIFTVEPAAQKVLPHPGHRQLLFSDHVQFDSIVGAADDAFRPSGPYLFPDLGLVHLCHDPVRLCLEKGKERQALMGGWVSPWCNTRRVSNFYAVWQSYR
jgi:hypothetical protein